MNYISDKTKSRRLRQRIKELEAELKTKKERNSEIIEAIKELFPKHAFLDGTRITRIEDYNKFVDKINKVIEL